MFHDDIRHHCLSKPYATEGFPFDEQTLVFKVGGKIYAVLALDEPILALKAHPDEVSFMHEHYTEVQPPRYFDKRHWYFVRFDLAADDNLLKTWINRSYALVWKSLPLKVRSGLGN